MFDDEDIIAGARVVNQSGKRNKVHQYKIEVWFKRKDDDLANRVRIKLGECAVPVYCAEVGMIAAG